MSSTINKLLSLAKATTAATNTSGKIDHHQQQQQQNQSKEETLEHQTATSSNNIPILKSEGIILPDTLPIITTDVLKSISKSSNVKIDRIEKKQTNIKLDRIRLAPVDSRNTVPIFDIKDDEIYDREEHSIEIERYRVEHLNDGQTEIWNYIGQNRNKIIMIQAGPGCGKSFVLKSIAYNLKNCRFDTIIYKHDLLLSFKYNSRRWSVARFAMKIWGLQFFQYTAFDKLLSSRISSYEFILVIISMIKKALLPKFKHGIVFLDEYTVVSKPILLVILMLLEYHEIGAVICGDRNQLQNIHNSRHAKLSSYRLATSFAHKQFELTKNERCSNESYNNFINYISKYSSDKNLDAFAYAIVSAVFLRQLIEPANYHQIHLAGTHQELSDLAHMMVCNNKYPVDFYYIDQSRLRDKQQSTPILQQTKTLNDYLKRIQNNEPPSVDKFLPYIPLVIGAKYYVNKHSEYSQGILKSINPDGTLTMEMNNGDINLIKRNTRDSVIFDQHREFLLDRALGKVYAYPIYPCNFMSIHKCQGCTITENLDLLLSNTNYQGLYVALSRVTRPEQIARVSIPNQISYIISTIINFPQHAENKPITVLELQQGLTNYIFYDVSRDMTPFSSLIMEFILQSGIERKRELRKQIISLAKNYPQTLVQYTELKDNDDCTSNLLTMSLIIKYRQVFLALSCLDDLDRNVWVHEYLLANSEMACLLPKNFQKNSKTLPSDVEIKQINELIKFANLNETYEMEMSTLDYIKAKSTVEVRMTPEDRKSNEKFLIESIDEYAGRETTEFCAKVYRRLINNEPITETWLIDELNDMLLSFESATISDPKKFNYTVNNDGESDIGATLKDKMLSANANVSKLIRKRSKPSTNLQSKKTKI